MTLRGGRAPHLKILVSTPFTRHSATDRHRQGQCEEIWAERWPGRLYPQVESLFVTEGPQIDKVALICAFRTVLVSEFDLHVAPPPRQPPYWEFPLGIISRMLCRIAFRLAHSISHPIAKRSLVPDHFDPTESYLLPTLNPEAKT